MNEFLKKIDGYKVYVTASLMALSGVGIMLNALNGEGDFNEGLQMLLEAMAVAGFRSTVNKFKD